MDKKELENEVKELLQIKDEVSFLQLYDKLHKYRTELHPDSYQTGEAKKIAEDKFKKVNSLLQELKKHLELDKVNRSTNELVPFEEKYEVIEYKHKNIISEERINELHDEVKYLKIENKELKNTINSLRDKKLEEKRNELKEVYKPKNQSWLIATAAVFLTALIAVLTSITNIGEIVTKFFPFDIQYFNVAMFSVIGIVIIFNVANYLKSQYLTKISKKIITPIFASRFIEYINEHNAPDNQSTRFTEREVFRFLERELIDPKKKIKRLVTPINEVIIDNFKDIFIYNLVQKELVEIDEAKSLDRNFKIIDRRSYRHWIDD